MGLDTASAEGSRTVAVPPGLTPREAGLVLRLLARLKARRFGCLEVRVGDGRILDVEVRERVDHQVLRSL